MTKRNPIAALFVFLWRSVDTFRKVVHLLLMLVIVMLVLAGLSGERVVIPDSAALYLAPSGRLVDQLSGRPFDRAIAQVLDEGEPETLVRDLVNALDSATGDKRITSVVLNLNQMSGGDLPKLQTIGAALVRFRESEKPIYVVGDSYTQQQYYLAAFADEIYMHEFGMVYIDGYAYYRTFFKNALEKLRLDLNVFRVGEFKSAVEPFLRDDMSDADKKAGRRWIEALWGSYQQGVETARALEPGTIGRYANRFVDQIKESQGNAGKLAVNSGLVDKVMGRQKMQDYLIEKIGESKQQQGHFAQIDHQAYLQALGLEAVEHPHSANIGIVVASGTIVDGSAPPGTVGGDTLAAQIQQAAADDEVDAVVLQVDSPGGSMFASEVVFEQLQRLKSIGKPLVVSMSGVAASGGYYISMPADEIWASDSTITGSIGVFGVIVTIQRTLEMLGISVDGFGTTPLAGQLRGDRSLNPEARQFIQATVEEAYRVFVDKVARSRDVPVDRVLNFAEGRVWIGSDAHNLGLIDHLGGLEDAIASAARLAGLETDDYGIKYIEPELTVTQSLAMQFIAKIQNMAEAMGVAADSGSTSFIDRIIRAFRTEYSALTELNDPRALYFHCFCVPQ